MRSRPRASWNARGGVIPLYYAREGMPWSPGWVERCKHAMATVIPGFNMSRVVNDYAEGIYRPAAKRGATLAANHFAGAAALVEFKRRVRDAWPHVTLAKAVDLPPQVARVGRLQMQVAVGLAGLRPGEVRVEIVGERRLPVRCRMARSSVRSGRTGATGTGVRISPRAANGVPTAPASTRSMCSRRRAGSTREVLMTPTHPLLASVRARLMKHLE